MNPDNRLRGDSPSPGSWLLEHGPGELEALFRSVVYHPSAPVLVAGENRNYREAGTGADRLLGIRREKIVGRKPDNFADSAFRPQIPESWKELLERGERGGTLRLESSDGISKAVDFGARTNVLPLRHPVALDEPHRADDRPARWLEEFALFLLDAAGCIAAWYAGAERAYGYPAHEAMGQLAAFLRYGAESAGVRLGEELERTAAAGHWGEEGWQFRKNGERFWANSLTMTLRDEHGRVQGFARIVRDFSDRHKNDEKLQRALTQSRALPPLASVSAVISGEFDRIEEANDAFLELVGYTRKDLNDGLLNWFDLTPPESGPFDELAHEECLRFGACTPFERKLIRRDGTRVSVLVAQAMLKLSPFRWIVFAQDLSARDRIENVNEEKSNGKQVFEEMIGDSAPLQRVQRLIEVVAPTDATVLVIGETGTGKELVARAIHRMSPRRHLPFITLNCAAIPTGLLESELFGYERGAFTGALAQKLGRFELAHRGTLFLDEVGDIPLDLQPKLLRALQEKTFERLGGTKTIPIDVRLVAATNRNLTQMIGDKLFRSDLYYRLQVFPISTPALRDHVEDIPGLTRYFTRKYAAKMGKQIERIPAETMHLLTGWRWPGNVRELENFIERSVILSTGASLRAPLTELRSSAFVPAGDNTLEQVQREHILKVLRESGGVVTVTATRLGLHRTTLNAMMKKLGISRSDV